MDVTVVIPTEGVRPRMLRRAIRSVAEQTYKPTRTLVVVDGPISSSEQVNSQQGLDAIDVVHTGEKLGVARARNLGVANAHTEYVAFLDDDDWWLPPFLESFLETGCDIGLASFWKHSQGRLVPEKTPPVVLHPRSFFVSNPGLRGSNLVIRAAAYRDVGGFDAALPSLNDLDLGVRLARQHNLKYVRSRERTVVFNQHSGLRLSTPGCRANTEGLDAFWRRYSNEMTCTEQTRFRDRAAQVWGHDLGRCE